MGAWLTSTEPARVVHQKQTTLVDADRKCVNASTHLFFFLSVFLSWRLQSLRGLRFSLESFPRICGLRNKKGAEATDQKPEAHHTIDFSAATSSELFLRAFSDQYIPIVACFSSDIERWSGAVKRSVHPCFHIRVKLCAWAWRCCVGAKLDKCFTELAREINFSVDHYLMPLFIRKSTSPLSQSVFEEKAVKLLYRLLI